MENSSDNLARMGFPVYKIPPEKGDFYNQIQLPGTYRQTLCLLLQPANSWYQRLQHCAGGFAILQRLYQQALYRHSLRQARPAPCVHRRVHETPSGNQTYFLYCDQSRNGLTLSTFRDSTLKNMPAGQWRCIIGQTDTLLSVSSRTAGAPRCFSLKSGAIITTPQCKRGCLRAMTYRQADTPLPSKSERSERRRQ